MNTTESQNKQILAHLQAGNTLTPIDALNHFGCLRLSARIHNLREKGHAIKMEMVSTRSGKRVARYSIRREMNIQKIKHSNFDLVEIRNGSPHCKKHGAMNKITKDGFWRCITVAGYKTILKGNSVSRKHMENICRTGCKEI